MFVYQLFIIGGIINFFVDVYIANKDLWQLDLQSQPITVYTYSDHVHQSLKPTMWQGCLFLEAMVFWPSLLLCMAVLDFCFGLSIYTKLILFCQSRNYILHTLLAFVSMPSCDPFLLFHNFSSNCHSSECLLHKYI